MRSEYATYREYRYSRSPGQREREWANAAVVRAVRSGKLVRPESCQRCGASGRIHGHHPDYSQPLVVEWLCVPCHGTEHKQLRAAANEARRARLKDKKHRLRVAD